MWPLWCTGSGTSDPKPAFEDNKGRTLTKTAGRLHKETKDNPQPPKLALYLWPLKRQGGEINAQHLEIACLSTSGVLSRHAAVQGACSSADCPYLHVNHGAGAPVCPAFLRGHCPKGAACSKKHVTPKMIREIGAARSPHPAQRNQVSPCCACPGAFVWLTWGRGQPCPCLASGVSGSGSRESGWAAVGACGVNVCSYMRHALDVRRCVWHTPLTCLASGSRDLAD